MLTRFDRPFNGEPAGRVFDDTDRALAHAGLAERSVVRNEALRDAIGDWPDELARDLDAEAGWAADQGLGALSRDDPRDLTALGEDWG
jgi:hypothetical protein